MSELLIEDVSIYYGQTQALKNVNLQVGAGEVVAVIGPSGCGKSSLLRAIAGLEPLTSGSIQLGGQSLEGVPTHRRDLGLMFQDHALFPHLSVRDNIAFGLRMQGKAGAERSVRVDDLLELVGLAGFGDRSIDALSGGEAQRVGLARALAPRPGLLMLDEPLGSLDRLLRKQLVTDLRSLFSGLGVTALHVTHDQSEAFTLADKVVILSEGEVQQIGKPVDVWRAPNSPFVAEFLGHPNLWDTGSGSVLVPVSAIAARQEPSDQGTSDGRVSDSLIERSVLVERLEFREGRFRVVARSTTPTFCGLEVGPVAVVFDVVDEPNVGDRLVIKIDHRQMVRF